jgi:hypothetical protein
MKPTRSYESRRLARSFCKLKRSAVFDVATGNATVAAEITVPKKDGNLVRTANDEVSGREFVINGRTTTAGGFRLENTR